jgi:hypothetical protein
MAIEVMDQACKMANISPDDVAVIFSSAMGDMQITDYMCRALAKTPKLISPTKFHNSVHEPDPRLSPELANNFGARLLPLLTAIADGEQCAEFKFPITEFASLSLALSSGGATSA